MLSHFVWYDRVGNARSVDTDGMVVDKNYACAHFVQNTQTYGYVADVGHIFKNAGFVRKDNCGNDSHGSVFRAAYLNFALQSASAFYNKLFQNKILSPVGGNTDMRCVCADKFNAESIFSFFTALLLYHI